MSPVHSYETTFAGILFLFLIISITLSLLATRHFTISLATLTRGAETITRGNYNYRVNVETGDEIEKLAEQFNLMAKSLFTHENEIQQYRSHLELPGQKNSFPRNQSCRPYSIIYQVRFYFLTKI